MQMRNGKVERIRVARGKGALQGAYTYPCVVCGKPGPRGQNRPYCFAHSIHGQVVSRENEAREMKNQRMSG